MNKLATIVVLTYNGEEYLIPFLDSIKTQTYRPIELIVADDASTDSTVKLAQEWIATNEDKDFKCKIVLNKENGGRAKNRMSSIESISGEYVFLADQDDEWISDKVERQVIYLEENEDCFAVSCDRKLMADGEVLVESEEEYRKRRHKEKLHFEEAIDFANCANYPANCICFRNEDIDKVFSIPESMKEPDYFLRAMLAAKGDIGYINEPLVLYRIHSNNLSGNFFAEVSRTYKDVFKRKIALDEKYNAMYEEDDQIIKNELKTRFNINSESVYRNRSKRKNVKIRAILYIIRTIVRNRKGKFLKHD